MIFQALSENVVLIKKMKPLSACRNKVKSLSGSHIVVVVVVVVMYPKLKKA